jgi:hypothetical protein
MPLQPCRLEDRRVLCRVLFCLLRRVLRCLLRRLLRRLALLLHHCQGLVRRMVHRVIRPRTSQDMLWRRCLR